MPSPFPGIDPYLESQHRWEGFHPRLVTYLCDALNDVLPESYVAELGERFHLMELLEREAKQILPDVKAAAREIAAARDLGIKVALDDFGTGHSSLTLLRSLPIDRVKIDQTFVRELTRDANDTAIVRSVITLANDLGLEVVAEGVETADVWKRLRQFDCDLLQGYHVSPPLPALELAAWLDSHPKLDAAAA